MANLIYSSNTGNAYLNLALDGWFLDNVKSGDIILYFFVNDNAVIIGRHQNAWRECDLANMRRDGVQLVRRHTGGGAVYHDAGNLNFSFIMPEKRYDLDRQMRVIMNAVASFGLECELSGRNDILVGGKKFSGNAFALSKGNRAHHGTLLVDADLTKLSGYLNVSKAKMRSKGIESVRARVCDLSELKEGIGVEAVKNAVKDAFIREYGEAGELVLGREALEDVEKRAERIASWEWTFGKTPVFDISLEHRFSFGEMQFFFRLRDGRIREAKIYSDCLDTGLVGKLEAVLFDCRFTNGALSQAVDAIPCGNDTESSEKEELKEYFRVFGPDDLD